MQSKHGWLSIFLLFSASFAFSQNADLGYTSADGASYQGVPVEELVYARFGSSPEPKVREQVAQGMFNNALKLSRNKKPAESAAAYDLVYLRFGQDKSANVLTRVLEALINKGFGLGKQKKYSDERAVYVLIEQQIGRASCRERV